MDPITAILTRDWAAVGGWSLLIMLAVFIVIGSFREWWVPGPAFRRSVNLNLDQQKLLDQQSKQITELTKGNELTKYVVGEFVQRRDRDRIASPPEMDGVT